MGELKEMEISKFKHIESYSYTPDEVEEFEELLKRLKLENDKMFVEENEIIILNY